MDILELAIKSQLPLIYIRTDDVINVGEVLSFIAGKKVIPIELPEVITKTSELQKPNGEGVYFTSTECKSLPKLYNWAVNNELTLIFVNTEKSVLQLDGGLLLPPRDMVLDFLKHISDEAETLVTAFGGLTLKDVGEIASMTMTRDESLTVKGVNSTRRAYNKLRGIQQVDTEMDYYVCPPDLDVWLKHNVPFFINSELESLRPRGLLFDGPPGTGKTLASKHIADTLGVPLYRLDVGSMKGKYVGESEGNLQAALAQVDQVEPCVVIFDEVEKIFQSTSDSGVTSSMLSQLLWWLQEHKSKVFTVMTTNNVTIIPDELHREGRIDQTMQFLGIPDFQGGFDFAKGAFDILMKQLQIEPSAEHYKTLNKRVKVAFTDGTAVPQTKLTNTVVNTLVREIAAEVKTNVL